MSRSVVRVTKSWNTDAHPRYPAGDERGGQFAPKDAGDAASGHSADWAERTARHVTVVHNGSTATIHRLERQAFGRELSPIDYIHLTGALKDSHIEVEPLPGGHLGVSVAHRNYEMTVILRRSGTLSIDWLGLTDYGQRGGGIGTRLLARQVEGAHRMGITRMSLLAGGDAHEIRRYPDSMNGYYTWPRLGYNARVPGHIAKLLQHAPSGSPLHRLGQRASITLHQLFDTPGGADFWRQHGEHFEGTFDPRPNSPHSLRLEKVLYEKGLDPYAD